MVCGMETMLQTWEKSLSKKSHLNSILFLQDAGRVAAAAKASGSSTANIPKISALSITKELLRTKGILGLYRGTRATMLRDVSFSVCYFPLFANLNKLGPKKAPGSSESVFWWSFVSGIKTIGHVHTWQKALLSELKGALTKPYTGAKRCGQKRFFFYLETDIQFEELTVYIHIKLDV